MAKITSVEAREILDSRGFPTVEVKVTLEDRTVGIASCPSGISVGKYEARELRDNDAKHFQGMGVLTAVSNIQNTINQSIQGLDCLAQQIIDKKLIELDGTPDKTRLGTNSLLPVSMAVAKAGAKSSGIPLYVHLRSLTGNTVGSVKIPTPAFNIINGGKHTGNGLDIQEFLLFPGSYKSFSQSLEIGVLVYRNLKKVLEHNYLSTLIGDEGGFAPPLATNLDALSLISQAVDNSALRLGYDVFMGIDASSNSFLEEGKYKLKDRATIMGGSDLSVYYQELIQKFHLIYIEDPFGQDDWDSWSNEFQKLGENTIISGDDLVATNPLRLQTALEKKTISGVIIKPNQIGTVMEAIAVSVLSRQAGLKLIASHRSGETNDDFISDFAVAIGADYMKLGSPARGERVAKYNRLLEIEQELSKT